MENIQKEVNNHINGLSSSKGAHKIPIIIIEEVDVDVDDDLQKSLSDKCHLEVPPENTEKFCSLHTETEMKYQDENLMKPKYRNSST